MPLADSNVWLALAFSKHEFHRSAGCHAFPAVLQRTSPSGTRRESVPPDPTAKLKTANAVKLFILVCAAALHPTPAVARNPFTAARAEDPVTLKWRFQKGQTFYQQISYAAKVNFASCLRPWEVNETVLLSWLPIEQDKLHNWLLGMKFEAIACESAFEGAKESYNSTNPPARPNALSKVLAPLTVYEFEFALTADYKVLNLHAVANRQIIPFPKLTWGADSLTSIAEGLFAVLPGKPVRKGMSWSTTDDFPADPFGFWRTHNGFTYVGREGRFHKMDFRSTPFFQPAFNIPGFTILNANFMTKEGAGIVLFDPDKGRIDCARSKLTGDGKWSILRPDGTITDYEYTVILRSECVMMDTNPLKQPKWPK